MTSLVEQHDLWTLLQTEHDGAALKAAELELVDDPEAKLWRKREKAVLNKLREVESLIERTHAETVADLKVLFDLILAYDLDADETTPPMVRHFIREFMRFAPEIELASLDHLLPEVKAALLS